MQHMVEKGTPNRTNFRGSGEKLRNISEYRHSPRIITNCGEKRAHVRACNLSCPCCPLVDGCLPYLFGGERSEEETQVLGSKNHFEFAPFRDVNPEPTRDKVRFALTMLESGVDRIEGHEFTFGWFQSEVGKKLCFLEHTGNMQ